MSKIVISADIHFCKRESLVADRYPSLVDSIRWADDLLADYHFDLGDVFNAANLSAEDVAVLDTIKFKNSWHCITGNHEQDGSNSLLKYFRDIHTVYDKPQLRNFGNTIGWVLFLPYMKEPAPLDFYLKKLPAGEKVLVFSHCEFLGMFGAEHGFSIAEIEKDQRIKRWFNGHYHTRALPSSKVVIVGNLVGKNFTQNFDPHGVCVYDSVADTFEFVENPYALRFGKLDTSKPECRNIRKLVESDPVKRYVLAIQTDEDCKDAMRAWADEHLVAYRLVTASAGSAKASESEAESTPMEIDHIALFFKEVCSRFGEDIANEIRAN